MKREIIRFRTKNQLLIDWLKSKFEISSFIESELEKIRTGFYGEKTILEDKKASDIAKLKKQCLKLDLDNYQLLKSLNFKHEQILDLITGKKTMNELFYPTLSEKPNFDPDYNCSSCNHKHFSFGMHTCTASSCLCGIRG